MFAWDILTLGPSYQNGSSAPQHVEPPNCLDPTENDDVRSPQMVDMFDNGSSWLAIPKVDGDWLFLMVDAGYTINQLLYH